MADYSQGAPPPPPPMLHTGRIPSFKNSHGENFQNRCAVEPPACVQNAMMTKDKKPFTYTPGGLDLSQIKTPSMARRLNKQQQQMEDGDIPNYQQRSGGVNGGPPAPPPPPPPPQLVINVSKSPKLVAEGERPEIVIPDNPIGMLRKTHSPYHWESEQADRLKQDGVPKFVDQAQQKVQQPRQFSQQPPQQTFPNNAQSQNTQQQHNKSPSTSPIWKPEPKYPNSPPQNNTPTPPAQTKDMLQRQDSQFNLSPSPWNREPPFSNSSSRQGFSPSVDTQSSNQSVPSMSNPTSPWRQEVVESPARGSPYQNSINQSQRNSPRVEAYSPRVEMCSPQQQPRSAMSPAQAARSPYQEQQNSQPIFNNVNRPVQSPEIIQRTTPQPQQNAAPWRQEPRVQMVQQDPYAQQQQQQLINQNYVQSPTNLDNPEVRYQTHMTIPVMPRKPKNEIQNNVSATPEIPFSPKIVETPKASLPWIKDDSKSAQQPPWCVRAQESPRVAERETESPVQPPWSNPPQNNTINRQMSQKQDLPGRVIPIQMEVSKNEIVQNSGFGQPQMNPNHHRGGQQQPQLRIIIDMNQQGNQQSAPKGNQQSQQQIMRVLQPQIMMMENNSKPQMTSPPPSNSAQQPKTRIIPIQMEPSSPGVSSPSRHN
ncbi:uncharacterized protein LOC143910630 isoform X2 [Arctopsyche grandis]|uniref:uncharacterized protein LOC143910630 isoform X2 n=1 Tax=Arctopsyche grandis TaxID=121162 RepID=UPI00406D8577